MGKKGDEAHLPWVEKNLDQESGKLGFGASSVVGQQYDLGQLTSFLPRALLLSIKWGNQYNGVDNNNNNKTFPLKKNP